MVLSVSGFPDPLATFFLPLAVFIQLDDVVLLLLLLLGDRFLLRPQHQLGNAAKHLGRDAQMHRASDHHHKPN